MASLFTEDQKEFLKKFAKEYQKKLPETIEDLARYLHSQYELHAIEQSWKTQQSCRVPFDKLPRANKAVMLALAKDILEYLNYADLLMVKKAIQNESS